MFQCPKCQTKLVDDIAQCPACGFEINLGAEKNNAEKIDEASRLLEDTIDLEQSTSVERLAEEIQIVTQPSLESLEETTDIPVRVDLPEFAQDESIMPPMAGTSDALSEEQESDELNKTISIETDKTVDLGHGLIAAQPNSVTPRSPENVVGDETMELELGSNNELDLESAESELGTIDLPPVLKVAASEAHDSVDDDLDTSTASLPEFAEPHVHAVPDDLSGTAEFGTAELQGSNDGTAILEENQQYLTSDHEGTLEYTEPLLPTIVPPSDASSEGDDSATVDLADVPDQASATIEFGTGELAAGGLFAADAKSQGTARYSSEELAAIQAETGRSSSSGRLRRVWGGLGGSAAHPSHTLKGIAARASESVFERVSERVLVSSNQPEIIDVAIQRAKDKQRDERVVRECLQTACSEASLIPDYQINGYLGRGAMGVVLQARQSAIGRDVAIKMIQPSADGTRSTSSARDMQKKFLYEAQITGKLDHPNIVPIYELGISNNILFYAMKKIVGKEWKEKIGKLSKDENLDIFMKVADAMALSHQRDVIHRDLKPENVMLGPFGEVLVTDWGCGVDLSLKEAFSGAGSPPWMAPEMALHQLRNIGPRSDIYLLGAILYQIVAGFPPHGGRTVMEVLLAASRNQILPTKKTDPLLKIAMKAMETEPADRFATVEEMQAAIRQYRKHAESITLTERSQATLESAQSTKDYERFSRSIFGFRDALELWPENSAAGDGLKNARLAYGQCAFDRKDYDLCLATVDRKCPDEDSLYVQAESAKKAALQREARFKTMRKALAAVVLIGLATSSVAAGVAWYQYGESQSNLVLAKENEGKAKVNEAKAIENAAEALRNFELAEKNAEKARANEVRAVKSADEAVKNFELAERNAEAAKANEIKAVRNANEAEDNRQLAEKNAAEAKANEARASERAAEVELAGIQSNLALSLGQVDQLDLNRAGQTLRGLIDESSYVSLASQGIPLLKNWAWNRVSLLSNADLLQQPLGQSVSAMAFSQQANRGVIALTRNGSNQLQVVGVENQQLVSDASRVLNLGANRVESASISPDGKSVLYSLAGLARNDPMLYRWDVDSPTSSPVSSAASRSFQGFVATDAIDVAGLNQGLWVWNRRQLGAEPGRTKGVQGRLMSIQLLSDETVLVLAEMPNGQRYPHIVSLAKSGSHQFLRTQNALGIERLSAVAYANGRLVFGTESGKIFTQPFTLNSAVANSEGDRGVDVDSRTLIEIPQQHYSRIKSIRPHSDGTLLTVAEEPNVQVWKTVEAEYGWRHEIRLAGTTSNVQRADFAANSDLVLAIAEDSSPIVWDITRQRQRQQARRMNSRGQAESYDAPVVSVVTSTDGRRAVSILENGKIDRWDVQTGLSEHKGEIPLSYIGHNPDAQFVDMAIDAQAGILITSARLPSQPQQKGSSELNKPARRLEWDWEFVKWDLNSFEMVDRWYGRSGEEQAISLAGNGRYVLYGSDSQTRIQDLQRQQDFQREDFGAFFGVPHPTATNLMMLVKLNGAVLLADVENLEASWKKPAFRLSEKDFAQIATNGNRPVLGQWSPAGDRFYLVWESGRITELAWDSRQLSIFRDSGADGARLDLSMRADRAGDNKTSTIRIGSRWDIDLKVRTAKGHNLVYLLVRFPGRQGLTRLTRLAFPYGNGKVIKSQSDARLESHYCVLSDEETPQAVTEPLAVVMRRLPYLKSDIAGMRTSGQYTFVATKDGVVHRIDSKNEITQVFGATKVLAGTGDRSGNTIATLHEGGLIWRADWSDGDWKWRQLPMVPVAAKKISMSPDGSQIAVCTDDAVKLVSAETGIQQATVISRSALVQWDRSAESTNSRLAAVDSSGSVQLIEGGKAREIGRIPAGGSAKGIHFFRESWNDPNKQKSNWLLVHSSAGAHDELLYFNEDPNHVDKNRQLALTGKVAAIECSPTEGLFVVGGYGTVAVYFAAPTLGEAGKELFGLQGHAGADVSLLHFSCDGKTLLTGDSSSRLFAWLSEDAVSNRPPKVSNPR